MSEWISVNDRLPANGEKVVFKYEYWRHHCLMDIEEEECIYDDGFEDCDYDDHYKEITHWKPL